MPASTAWKASDEYYPMLQLGKLQSTGHFEEHSDMEKKVQLLTAINIRNYSQAVKPIRDYLSFSSMKTL